MSGIADLPVELFLDGIFPHLSVADLARLGATNKFLNGLSNDDAYWHRRIQEDFNFPNFDTARETGWKFLYKRLSDPKAYVWGEKSKSRLGLLQYPPSNVRDGVPFPTRLAIPGARIVSLAAGGMSFNAIDSKGDLYVWGILNGTSMALRSDGFADSSQKADEPTRLELPVKFRSISCGRLHNTAMDASANVWTFTSWGQPFRLGSSLVDKTTPETTPVQVESGWTYSAILTESGDILVYWPFEGEIQRVLREKKLELESTEDEELKEAAKAKVIKGTPDVVPCHWWIMEGVDPVRLPPIPVEHLPQLRFTGLSREELEKETKLVKVAGYDRNLIGLTNKGHVLRYTNLISETDYQQGRWEYLPLFSDVDKLKELPVYNANDAPLAAPETMHITHISASFETFFAYSVGESSVVLQGKGNDAPAPTPAPHPNFLNNAAPTVIPTLQNQSVIAVVVGDYHYGALTSSGRLLSWGQFSRGALGLGDPVDLPLGSPGGYVTQQQRDQSVNGRWGVMQPPPDVSVPTEVRFDHGAKRSRSVFVFAAAAAGWHSGALAIDLDPDQEQEEEAQTMPGGTEPFDESLVRILPVQDPGSIPRLGQGLGRRGLHFRIGFAGRGMRRGGGP
ncbi:RCC1/BLIP-II [Epithele typhae]|uniref:RCC1/BLIP-II n=1 Tax=Epithele typhae TaxID=378194 RepID=UPI0020072674|nr:RCC1/BLIP-II [Epithele typhae]KAH9940813.1 RCC1/BLIP-II [Epithele typhae]